MRTVAILAMALFCAFFISPTFSHAADVLMNNFGYLYETGGFPVSEVGDILEGVGNVTSFSPAITCDLTANELTWTIRDLVSYGQIIHSERYILVSYSGGVLNSNLRRTNDNMGFPEPSFLADCTFTGGTKFGELVQGNNWNFHGGLSTNPVFVLTGYRARWASKIVFAGPLPAEHSTWGNIKALYASN